MTVSYSWGNGNLGDIPTPGDFDGDNDEEAAVYRPTDGKWYLFSGGSIAEPGVNNVTVNQVHSDFNNDGRTDTAYWAADFGYWVPYVIDN